MEKNSDSWGWAFMIAFVVWLLGTFWHPFGYPTNAWHWIFGVLMVIFAAGYFYCVKEEEKPEEETEE